MQYIQYTETRFKPNYLTMDPKFRRLSNFAFVHSAFVHWLTKTVTRLWDIRQVVIYFLKAAESVQEMKN